MKQIIQMNHKEMIVSNILLFFIVLSFFNCSQKKDKDEAYRFLELISVESQYQKEDSIYLSLEANEKQVARFFKLRNTKEFSVRLTNKDGSRPAYNDSSYHIFDTIIYKPKKIKSNQYLFRGKGVHKDVELFLKDSFLYDTKEIFYWKDDKYSSPFIKNEEYAKRTLTVSKPVYNQDYNKAIVFVLDKKNRTGRKIEAIYFLQKEDEHWKILFSEKEQLIFSD